MEAAMPLHDWTRIPTHAYHDFHGRWIYAIRHALNQGILPPGYYARADQVSRTMGPDILTLQTRTPPFMPVDGEGIREGNRVAVTESPPRVRLAGSGSPRPPRFRQRRVAVRHSSNDRLIAIIELVSPGNKSSEYPIRQFVNKIVRAVDQGIHVLVIDPFPPGRRDPNGIHGLIWPELGGEPHIQPTDTPLTLASYEAPDAAGGEPRFYVEPLAANTQLPDMPLFLEPGYYVPVPLERAYLDAFADVLPQDRALLEPQ